MKRVMNNPNGKSLLLTFTIEWYEGEPEHVSNTYSTWQQAQDAYNAIYNNIVRKHGGVKSGVTVVWNNGTSISLRVEVSEHHSFCPWKQDIGTYLKAICEAFPCYMDCDTSGVSFEDYSLHRPKCTVEYYPVEYSEHHVFPDGSIIKAKSA